MTVSRYELSKFPRIDGPCFHCEKSSGDIRLFMGIAAHVECVQKNATVATVPHGNVVNDVAAKERK